MYYDAHTHLNSDEIYPQRQAHLKAFIDVWGQWLVTVGTNKERNRRACDIAQTRSDIQGSTYSENLTAANFQLKVTIGYHPWEISYWHISSQEDVIQAEAELRSLLETPASRQHIVAIGECGTDLHYIISPEQHILQQELFAMQCRLAMHYWLPVVVHTRDDFRGTREIVQQFPELRFYFHCRSYSASEVETVCSWIADYFFGFCGNTTYPKATQIRESLSYLIQVHQSQGAIPPCILLETDAPYLTPQPRRGQPNTPQYISGLYAYLSEYLSVTPAELQQKIQHNFLSCYNLDIM